jgi:hypothetical protein
VTTQLDCSIGAALESTYGTAVTVTKFVEFTDESLDPDYTFAQGEGLRVGSRVLRAGRRPAAPVKQLISGDFTSELVSKGLGWIFNAALGSVTSTQRATTGVYQHNFTLTTTDYLPSYTIQKGVPPLGGGATNAYTFPGMVCSSLEIDCPNSDIVTLKPAWNGRELLTATAYAAPAYPTPMEVLRFTGANLTIGGSPTAPTTTALAAGGTSVANVRDFKLTIDNGIDDGGFNIGSGGKRARKPAVGIAAVTGSMTIEYDSTTMRDAFVNQNDLALVFTVQGSTVIGTGSDVPALSIYIPDIRLEGDIPNANKGGVITQSVDFTVLDNLTVSPITLSYVSTDTAP